MEMPFTLTSAPVASCRQVFGPPSRPRIVSDSLEMADSNGHSEILNRAQKCQHWLLGPFHTSPMFCKRAPTARIRPSQADIIWAKSTYEEASKRTLRVATPSVQKTLTETPILVLTL